MASQSLFFQAIKDGDINAINSLLAQGDGHPNLPNSNGWNPLQFAIAKSDHLPIIQLLLDNGADPNMPMPFFALSAAAIYERQTDIFRALLVAGADPNARDFNGNTAIHQAFQWERPRPTIQCIVQNGGNVNHHDCNGKTILMNAILRNKSSSYIRWLVNDLRVDCTIPANGSNTTALHFYAQYGEKLFLFNLSQPIFSVAFNPSIFANLIRAGADINAIDSMGTTPLYHAVQVGNNQLVKALLRIGADPNLSDHNNRFPLHIAITGQQTNLIGILITAGADVNAPDANGSSPLHLAARTEDGHFAAAYLLNSNCNLDATDNQGRTAFHEAAIKGDCHLMFALSRDGANVNIQDAKGMTPLHHAVLSHNNFKASMFLASTSMADMSIRDRYGRTALYYALLRKPNAAIISFFVKQSPTQFNTNN